MFLNIWKTIDEWGIHEPNRMVFENQRTHTYGELKIKSDQIADFLRCSISAKSPVAVLGDSDFEMLAFFIGAAKSGHPYIPIDIDTPIERIELILTVAKPALVLNLADYSLPEKGYCVCSFAELTAELDKSASNNRGKPVLGADTCYIIFTSGTTGEPKGVQISHDNLSSFVAWMIEDFDLKPGQRWLSQAPYSFDLSVMSLYPALLTGGTLVSLNKKVTKDFKALFAFLGRLDVAIWVSTPSFLDICLMEPDFCGKAQKQLQKFFFCGEELTKKTAEKLLDRFPNTQIYNTYGPTETTVAVTGIEVTPDVLTKYRRLPIGYPKSDTQIFLMKEGRLVSEPNEVGEIIIGGPSVSRGYLNNSAKTEASFFMIGNQPAYRTGDAGRLAENGLLLYEGRIDFQVKLNGYRIELEDIDHYLTTISEIKQATVVPKYQGEKVQQLIAYIVLEKEIIGDYQLTKTIKNQLGYHLMEYMIPQRFVFVEQLPLTTNGKIDRKALIHEVNS